MLWWRYAHVLGWESRRVLKGKSEIYSLNVTCLAKPGSCHAYYALNFMNIMFTSEKKKKLVFYWQGCKSSAREASEEGGASWVGWGISRR